MRRDATAVRKSRDTRAVDTPSVTCARSRTPYGTLHPLKAKCRPYSILVDRVENQQNDL